MYVGRSSPFKSLNKIIKPKASLGPQWITGIAVGQDIPK